MQQITNNTVKVTKEIEIANILADDGNPVVTHWYEPDPLFYSADKLAVRNRANVDFWQRQDFTRENFPAQHTFTQINGAPAVINAMSAIDVDINFDEYTVFIIAKLADSFTTGTTAAIGTIDDSAVVNTPYLLYNKTANGWQVYGEHTNKDLQITSSMGLTAAKQPHLYTLTRSSTLGASLRIDGQTTGTATTATAKAPITSKKCRLLGFNFTTGALNGTAGIIIMCRKDLTSNKFAMQKIESYLMSKYGIATP